MSLNKLFVIDYSCHPFSLDLTKEISKNGFNVSYFFSKNVNLTGKFYKLYNKNFQIHSIDVGNIPKNNFFLRRFKEVTFGKKIIKNIKREKPKKILLANVPIEPLYHIIKYCKKNNIETFFWVQDIYYLAIKNIFKRNFFLYYIFGFFLSKLYEYYEFYCFKNSTKNILIDKKFLNHFPKISKNHIIKNWIPIEKFKIKENKNNYLIKLVKKKFTFVYTGTLSYKHHSNVLIELAKKFPNSNIIILSNDKFANDLLIKSKEKKIKNIYLNKLISYHDLTLILQNCKIGLVNLTADSNEICVPSKILTYYKYGIPVLGSMPLKNSASINIKRFKTGLVSDTSDLDGYLKNASIMKNNFKLRRKFSINGKRFANKEFNIFNIYKKFKVILKL